MGRLHPDPELGRGAEIAREAERCVGGDRALGVDDLADADLRHIEGLGERVLTHAHRLQEILAQHVARMGGGKIGLGSGHGAGHVPATNAQR